MPIHHHQDQNEQQLSTPQETTKTQQQSSSIPVVDNRPEAQLGRALQEQANNSPQAQEGAQLKASAQEKSDKDGPQQKVNKTGIPDRLKAVVEHFSGFSLEDVRVHYNSEKPALVKAHAYAEGLNIYIGPGQEKHLAHEVWHVVQQMKGEVKTTTKVNGKNINDDASLEKEAESAKDKTSKINKKNPLLKQEKITTPVIQRISDEEQQQAIIDIDSFATTIPPDTTSAPIWKLPNDITIIGTSHSEQLNDLPFSQVIYDLLQDPFDHVITEINPNSSNQHDQLDSYITAANQLNTLKQQLVDDSITRRTKLFIERRDIPAQQSILDQFPSGLDNTITALASTTSTIKNQLETQQSRTEAEDKNNFDGKNNFDDTLRERVIQIGKEQQEAYVKGDFHAFYTAVSEDQQLGFDRSDIEERNLQWLDKRSGRNKDNLTTIPNILALEGRKLIIVGASHVPTIIKTLEREEHERDLIRLGSDFQ
ncbi:MAG: eCIS core domain-containing protein [Aureispira sp.]